MAMIAIPISSDVSRLFRGIDLEDNVVRDVSDHITLFYLGDNISVHEVIKMIPTIFDITSKMEPFELSCSKVTCFPKGKKGYPIIGEIKSKQLMELREKIRRIFERKGIKYDNKFPEFKPHVTLGFSKKKVKNFKINKTWLATQMSIYGGDTADTRLFVNFPFDLGVTTIKKASENVLRGKEKMSLEQVISIPRKRQLDLINVLKKKIKNHEVVKNMFDKYDVDIDEIDLIPMGFADLDVSARTDHGTILLNYRMLQDGSFLNDDHYLVHEITHFLQQTTGDGPTSGGKKDYLDNKYEQEGFQNQTSYIADTKGEEVAEEYVEQVMDKHEVPSKERETKKDQLLGD